MTEEQINYMVERFLCWELPDDFAPDAGISFDKSSSGVPGGMMPIGTNVLNATQAQAMVRHMVSGMPDLAATKAWFDALEVAAKVADRRIEAGRAETIPDALRALEI